MYQKKVLQGVPNFKRTANLRILNLLVMPKSDSQCIRYRLLGQPFALSGGLQLFSHALLPSSFALASVLRFHS